MGDEQARRFFEESGFAVGRAKGLRCGDPVLIAHTLEAVIRDTIAEVDGPDADAVVVVGTNLPVARVAAAAEFWPGRPVVALNTATCRHALRTFAVEDRVRGFGRPLAEFRMPGDAPVPTLPGRKEPIDASVTRRLCAAPEPPVGAAGRGAPRARRRPNHPLRALMFGPALAAGDADISGMLFWIYPGVFIAFGLTILVALLGAGWGRVRAAGPRHDAAGAAETPPEEPRAVLTLVHGTWARGAAWTRPGSPLCRELGGIAQGRVVFRRFRWSGANSFRARRRAAEALRRSVQESVEAYPGASHFIIGHSHGGNVALRSVTPELQRSVGGVACLATPVLVSRPRRYHPLTSAMFDWMGVLPAAVVAHHLATFSAPLIGVAHDRAASLYWVALSAASFFLIRAIRRGLSAADFSVEPVALDNRRVLFIRMVGDEASAAISAAHVLSLVVERITTTPFHALGTVMAACEAMREAALERWGLGVAASLLLFGSIFIGGDIGGHPHREYVFAYRVVATLPLLILAALVLRLVHLLVLFLSVVYSSVLLLPMLLVTAVFALATGPELAVFAVLTYVTAEVCPPGRWEVLQLAEAGAGPPPARGQGLQHSIVYESPLALRALRAWIEERMPHRRAEPAG